MRIQILSDLHFEFFRGERHVLEFILGCLPKNPPDVLVLAGDITIQREMTATMPLFRRVYDKDIPILYLLGNHEFYGSTRVNTLATFTALEEKIANFHALENDAVEIFGQKFVGCTLWFPDLPDNLFYERQVNDFNLITRFKTWLYAVNEESIKFLEDNVDSDTVVLTHHLPSIGSVGERFFGSALNRFFLCPLDNFIEFSQPKLWIHGHTHDSFDYNIGKTRVVCNPSGYYGSIEDGTNPEFNHDLIVEI